MSVPKSASHNARSMYIPWTRRRGFSASCAIYPWSFRRKLSLAASGQGMRPQDAGLCRALGFLATTPGREVTAALPDPGSRTRSRKSDEGIMRAVEMRGINRA